MTSSDDMDAKNLRNAAMEGHWSEVLKLYKKKKELRMLEITQTKDTVLHMAASSGKVFIVEWMVDMVCEKRNNDDDHDHEKDDGIPMRSRVNESGDDKKDVLGVENENGDTTLHLAASASKGSVQMCKKIAGAEPSLISKRNKLGETPLFMAAKHGNHNSFLWLHYLRPQDSLSPYGDDLYKAKNDDTILHCAMAGGYIDLAIDIVLLYEQHLDKMIERNKNGLSPLHYLAATPSVFQSTDLPDRSYAVQLIYHFFLRVKEKEQYTRFEELKQQQAPMISFEELPTADIAQSKLEMTSSWKEYFGLLIQWLLVLLAFILLLLPGVVVLLFLIAGDWFQGIRKMKEKHTWTLQIMKELLPKVSYEDIATEPYKEDNEAGLKIVDTPLITAAKNGVQEMVKSIRKSFPSKNLMDVADDEGKNIVLLSAEKRQTKLYQFLCGSHYFDNDAFRKVDTDGNTALHLAAKAGINLHWQTTTMIEEFKWFECVKRSVPCELWEKYNKDGKTAENIFRESYKEHMTGDKEWLNQTSQTCSVASTLVASMAFSNMVQENFKEENTPLIVALSLSLTSTICFLAILAFRSHSLNFWRYVPFMLQLAILTMFGSIVALWTSLMLHGKSLATYAILGSPIAILTIVSLPIFIGPALKSMFAKVPPRNRNITSALHYQKPQKDKNDRNQEPASN